MYKKILLSGLMVVSSSAVVWAQVPRTSTTSTSSVSSARTSAGGQSSSSFGGSSMGGSSMASSAMSSDFQPIERGGFVGRSQQGTGFVGRSSSGTSGSGMSGSRGMGGMGMGSMGMGGMGMGSMGMGGMGGSNRMGGLNSTQNQNSQTKIRTTMRLGFRYARPNVQAVSQRVQSRWVRLPVSDSIKGVSMNFDNGVATLTGKVATAEEKRMAEKLILLEPGVSSVQNQLEVTEVEAETP